MVNCWPLTWLDGVQLTPSRVRRLFGVVVVVAVCSLLLELQYIRSSCAGSSPPCTHSEGGTGSACLHKVSTERHHTEPPGHAHEVSAQRSHKDSQRQRQQARTARQKVIVPLRRVHHSQQQQKPAENLNDQDASPHKTREAGQGQRWVILDVTADKCRRRRVWTQTPPQGWTLLLASRPRDDHHNDSSTLQTLPTDKRDWLTAVRTFTPVMSQIWRKMDAFLWAIAQGASVIVDVDCSLSLTQLPGVLEELGVQNTSAQGLMYNATLLFNPYAHFGAWALAPRAALHTGLWNNSRLYHVRDFSSVLVKHAVFPRSDDAMVVTPTQDSQGTRFDPSYPSVFVGQRSLVPVVADCSLYQGGGLWAVLDPCLTPGLHCRVLTTLLQQRLLRELDAFTGLFQHHGSPAMTPRHSQQPRGWDTSLLDLARFLDAWKCEDDLRFYQCVASLTEQLRIKGHLTKEEGQKVTWFLSVLVSLNLTEPARVKTPWRGVRRIGEFRVKLGSVNNTLEEEGEDKQKALRRRLVEPVRHRCEGSATGGSFLPVTAWKTPAVDDVVLMVVFNKNVYFWRNIGFLENAYRPYFKHIAYCVTNLDSLIQEDYMGVLNHITVVEGLTTYWYLMYGCTAVLMQMGFRGVRGYLQMGDDTLLNPWNLLHTSHDVIFMHNIGNFISARNFFVHPHWRWWITPQGRCPLLNVMAELEEVSGMNKDVLRQWAGISSDLPPKKRRNIFSEIVQLDKKGKPPPVTRCYRLPGTEVWAKPTREQARQFLYNYYKEQNMSGFFIGKTQDFFYMPQTMARDFVTMSHLFMSNQVIVELALHAIQTGLAKRADIRHVGGSSLWHEDRHNATKFFNPAHFYLHPFKTMYTLKAHQRDFYCDIYLRTLVARLKDTRRH